MLTQFATPPPNDKWLLDIELAPELHSEQKSSGDGRADPGTILTARGRRNRVQIGVPQVVDVLAGWPVGERLASEIEAARDRFSFLSARLACSVIADQGCRFTFVRCAVRLVSECAKDGACAVDLFPQTVTEPRQFSRAYKVTGGLKFGFGEVSGEIKREDDVIRYEPTVTATGLLTETPAWSFRASSGGYLDGIREIFLIVKVPAGALVEAQFTVEAVVSTALGPIPLRRYRHPDLLKMSYALNA